MKILTTLAAALLPALALAQTPTTAGPDESKGTRVTFESLDRNSDQKLSKTEAAADDTLTSQFAMLDTNSDGYIARSEYLKGTDPSTPTPRERVPAPDPR